jgi:beta-xylosidase
MIIKNMKKLQSKYHIVLSFIVLGLFVLSCSPSKSTDAETQSDATFENPVLGGDYPDPSVVRDGEDFYLTHSSFEYYPGLMVWHSTDLIHWTRISHALTEYVGSVWAPDLIKHNNKFYIYFPAGGTNWVVTADSPEGPWSAPVDLKLSGFIDPGHLVDENGQRYLYLSKGYVVKLADDGLSTLGEPVFNYAGWEFPKEWSTECFCLESPKSTVKDGFYHIIVAEGGTAGPATSHMVVAGRAKSPYGPFENSPYNPIIHTEDRSERWWSQGHGTLVDDLDGKWWMIYHGYERGFHTLGRQSLLLPIEWTEDNWFRVPEGVKSFDNLPLPAGKTSVDGSGLSDDFNGEKLALQWQFFKDYDTERIALNDGELILQAKGEHFEESSPILVNASDQKYEVIVQFTIDEDVTAGLCLYYNEKGNMRITIDKNQFTVYNQQRAKIRKENTLGDQGFLRILNDGQEVSFYFSANGKDWTRVERTIEASGFNHNVFGEFLSLRAGLFAYGGGEVRFDNFVYRKL